MTDSGGTVLAETNYLSGLYDSYAGLEEATASLRKPQELPHIA